MKNDLIVNINDIMECIVQMSENERKLIFFLISKLNKEEPDCIIQIITIKEFEKLIVYKGNSLSEYLESFRRVLATKTISVKCTDSDRVNIPWFSYIKHSHNKGIIEIALNHYLVPHLFKLNINYTASIFENFIQLKTRHALRIYELLVEYEKTKKITIDLETLRQMLGIMPNQYKLYGHFKAKLLNIAQEELSQNNDINLDFDFEEIKKGRKVVAINFNIKSKKS